MSERVTEKYTDQSRWQDLTVACDIYLPGTSAEFRTGDWRTDMPIWDAEKCKQCLLCTPACPDSSIPVTEGKRLDFDYDHCKGCGICAQVCPFGAITMVKEEK